MDETYIKVKGRLTYLYRALDKNGNTIDFYLSSTRNANAAKHFLGKALKFMALSHIETGTAREKLDSDFRRYEAMSILKFSKVET